MSSVALPRIFGFSEHTGELGSQLADGQIDMLTFAGGVFTASSLVAGTAGLPTAVGISTFNSGAPAWNGVASAGLNGDVIDTQTANGSLDILGLSGTPGGALALGASDLVASSVGTPTIGEINSDSTFAGENYQNGAGTPQGLEATTMTASGQIDLALWDVGALNPANTGLEYATNMLSGSFAGWSVVEGGTVNSLEVFPVT